MAEYRHNAVVVLGSTLAGAGIAVTVGWWAITATNTSSTGFWQLWLIAPSFAVAAGLVLILGVLFDWFPSLGSPRRAGALAAAESAEREAKEHERVAASRAEWEHSRRAAQSEDATARGNLDPETLGQVRFEIAAREAESYERSPHGVLEKDKIPKNPLRIKVTNLGPDAMFKARVVDVGGARDSAPTPWDLAWEGHNSPERLIARNEPAIIPLVVPDPMNWTTDATEPGTFRFRRVDGSEIPVRVSRLPKTIAIYADEGPSFVFVGLEVHNVSTGHVDDVEVRLWFAPDLTAQIEIHRANDLGREILLHRLRDAYRDGDALRNRCMPPHAISMSQAVGGMVAAQPADVAAWTDSIVDLIKDEPEKLRRFIAIHMAVTEPAAFPQDDLRQEMSTRLLTLRGITKELDTTRTGPKE